MPRYKYTAMSGPGARVKGTLDAASPAVAARELTRMGYLPTYIRPEAPRWSGMRSLVSQRRYIPLAEISSAFRQLSDLVNAGLPLASVLNMAAEQSAHPVLKSVLQKLASDVREGRSLSEAMAAHRDYFPTFYQRLVYAGETGGTLDRVLERLADLTEAEDETRSQVRAAMAYPLFIVAAGTITVLFLLSFVVPRLAAMFADFHQTLPLPTQILLGVSGTLHRYWWAALPSAFAVGAMLRHPKIRLRMKNSFDDVAIRLPVVKTWVIRRETSSYARTLGSLLKSGVPILQALSISAETARNRRFKAALAPIAGRVREGAAFSRCLRDIPMISADLRNLAAVGEEGGRLDEILLKIADSYERRSQRELKTAVSLIEPLLILMIGAALGLIVISIMLPIFDMNALIR